MSVFRSESPPSPEAQAGKFAWPWSLGHPKPTFPAFPAVQTCSAEKSRDHACRAEPACPLGLPQPCFEFARASLQDARDLERAAKTNRVAANEPSPESPKSKLR